jgi:hypothetical protein
MKKLLILTLLFILASFCVKAQNYGDQTPIVINGITCLLHLPDTYDTDPSSQTYPLLIMFQGAGETGSNPMTATIHGTGWAIKNNKWNPDAVHNFRTGQDEKFIVLSTLYTSAGSGFQYFQQDNLYKYMVSKYRVDTTCMGSTGLSRGGGASMAYPAHISFSNCCPASFGYTTPTYKLCTAISMSSEMLDNTPCNYLVADSVRIWGWSDSNDCQSHGKPIKHFIQCVQAAAPTLGALYTYFHSNSACHGGWDSIYTETTRQTIDGHSMNIYEYQLYYRRGSLSPPPPNSIVLGTITNQSFCVTTSTGSSAFSVPFTTTGTFAADNTFSVQMSDASGQFVNYTIVGTGTTSPISCTIPANTPTGNYKFRVASSNPIVTSGTSTTKPINLAANKITPTTPQTINAGTSGTTLTVRDSSTATAHQWYSNGVAISGQTGTTYTPNFPAAGTYNITCKSTFSCGVITSNTVVITVVSVSSSKVYVTKTNSPCGFYNYSAANPGDTLVLTPQLLGDTLCVATFIHLHGTPAKHITIIAEGGVIKSTAPLTLADDCYFVDINFGTQTNLPHATGSIPLGRYGSQPYDVPYGFEVFGAVTPGAGFEIHGKDSNITASNIYVHDRGAVGGFAGYGIIIKNDPNAYGCDSTYAYPNMFKNITCHDFVFKNINKDVLYLGYSGGYNGGGQSVTCNGVQRFFRPAGIGNLLMYNMYCENALRSFIQAGQLWGGNSVFHDMYAYNLGNDSLNGVIDGAQGAFAAMGIPDSSWSIYNCGGAVTWLHNVYTYGYGVDSIYNNRFDSAGYVHLPQGGVARNNGQSNIATFPRLNTSNTPLRFVFTNNSLGTNTQGAGGANGANFRLDFGTSLNPYATSGNVICNNSGQAIYNPPNVQYVGCAPLNTITTSNISPTSFCITPTVGANITVNFTTTGTFNAGNVFTAYLSDANGNFASQTAIGSTSSGTSISAIIPANTPYGSGYKIKVQSSNPVVVGTASNNSATIVLVSNSITPTATQNIYTDSTGDVLTVADASTGGSHQWFANGVAISGQTGTTYIPVFSSAGTYTITCKTTYSCGIVTSNSVTINVTDAPPPPPQTITTGTISGSPFCVTTTAGVSTTISFTSSGTYISGNQYQAQLSGKGGGWGNPTTIGTLTSTGNSGTINITIPANALTGTAYRIRIVSTNPAVTGTRTAPFTINLASNNVTPSATQNILTNTNGSTLTVNETSSATGEWLYGNISGTYTTNTGITAKTFTPNFAVTGSYYIVYKSVFSCLTDTSNEVLVNVSVPNPPPPDTVCSTTQIQHDTAYVQSFPIDTSVCIDSVTRVTQRYIKILWFKLYLPLYDTAKVTVCHDSTYYYDSVVNTITPLHDTTICIPSYKMGVMYLTDGSVSVADRIDTIKNYIGVNYMRLNITRGESNAWHVQQANDSGMHVLQTINNSPEGSSGFDTYVQSQYDLGKPELVTGTNEPTVNVVNQQNNIADLQTLIDVSHPLGIKVADGGITADVAYYIINYWNTHGKTDSATWLRQTLGLNMASPAATKAIGQYDTLFTAYSTMDLDYVNIHFYEPPRGGDTTATHASGLLPILINFVGERTNKPIMTNEYGTFNHSCNLLNELTSQGLNSGLKYMIYLDGNGIGGAIKNQDCFKAIIAGYQ